MYFCFTVYERTLCSVFLYSGFPKHHPVDQQSKVPRSNLATFYGLFHLVEIFLLYIKRRMLQNEKHRVLRTDRTQTLSPYSIFGYYIFYFCQINTIGLDYLLSNTFIVG